MKKNDPADPVKWKTIPWNQDYEISNEGLIRRRIAGKAHAKIGVYLLPFLRRSSGSAFYSIEGVSSFEKLKKVKLLTPKRVDFLMEEFWPEIARKKIFDIEWTKNTREWVRNNQPPKGDKYITRKIDQVERACRRCGKPSGVNYWCNDCHEAMAEYDCGHPAEGYTVGRQSGGF